MVEMFGHISIASENVYGLDAKIFDSRCGKPVV